MVHDPSTIPTDDAEAAQRPILDVARMTRLGRAIAATPSPCGTWLAVAVQRLNDDESKYVSDIWRVAIRDSDAAPVQLTRGDADDKQPRFRRDGALAFLSNRNPRAGDPEEGDTERYQVWIMPVTGGEPRPLTDEPLGVMDYRFAPAGDRLLVIAGVLPGLPHEDQRAALAERRDKGPSTLRYTRMPVRFWDHWIAPVAPHAIAYREDGTGRRDLTPEADREFRHLSWDISPDGRRLAITKDAVGSDRVMDSSILIIDIESGATQEMGTSDRVAHSDVVFAPDGNVIACVRRQRPTGRAGKPGLWLYDAAGAGRALAQDWDCWPTIHGWTPDGSALLATAEVGGDVPAYHVAVADGARTRITSAAAGGSHVDLHPVANADGSLEIVGLRHKIIHPPEPFIASLAQDSEPQLLAELSGFSASEGAAMARWESFTATSADGSPVQSFLVTPIRDEASAPPLPALVAIHGGPIGQHSDGWHWRWNALVKISRGYAVALPNPRGSTGFGQEFIEGIWDNNWGGACYDDLMAVTDYLADRKDIDAQRIAAIGGSFGGYMANWIGGHTDRYRCLVSHAGIYWMSAFQGTTDNPAYFALMTGESPYGDSAEFDKFSPHRSVADWKTPTLVIHGEKDYRVPVSEALLLFEALQLHGVDSELLIFPDENHWILKPRNIREWYDHVFAFLAKHMGEERSE